MYCHTFVFVTGLHRSGTSPLHHCLRRHPHISGFQDTGVSEDEGQHLQTILPRGGAYGGPGRFGRHREAHLTESHPQAKAETGEALFAQWSLYWDISKPYLVEKTPITLLRTRLFQAVFPTSYFVVIVRHPAVVALSTYNALNSFGAAQDLTLGNLIEHWLLCHETFLADAAYLRRLAVLKYEDFVARPPSVLDALYGFLGLPPHASGDKIEAGINDSYLAQWRAMMEDPQHWQAIEQAMDLELRVRRFGYSLQDWTVCEPIPEVPGLPGA